MSDISSFNLLRLDLAWFQIQSTGEIRANSITLSLSRSLPNKYNIHFETYTSKKIHQLHIRSSRMTHFFSANIQTEGQFPRLHKTRATGAFIRAGSTVIVAESAARGRQQTKSTFGTLHH